MLVSANTEEEDSQSLLTFAKKCLQLKSQYHLNTYSLTPLNFSEERQKFFESTTYNPIFVYRNPKRHSATISIDDLRFALGSLKIPRDLHDYFHDYIVNLDVLRKTSLAVGAPEFGDYAGQLFSIYQTNVNEIVEGVPIPEFVERKKYQLHDAWEISEIFKTYLDDAYQMPEYSVLIDHFNDHTIRVGGAGVTIGSAVKRNCNNVQRLIVHEIESHMIQRYNLRHMDNPLSRLIKPGESELYAEGMAVYNEIFTKTITKKAYRTYLYRVHAVGMLDKSFREIFEYLREYMGDHTAFITTYRVKRGMGDTSLPGGYPKDASYLLGYKAIHEYLKNGGDHKFLYVARHPYYGELLDKYHLVQPKDYILPRFLNRQKLIS